MTPRPSRSEIYTKLRQRRNPENRALFEAYHGLKEDDSVKYLAAAMDEIPPEYTKKTKEEVERVQNQIIKGLERESLSAIYRLQGSVMKNTHVRGYSDVDLLVIETRFESLEPPQQPANPYKGDPVADLLQIRTIVATTLKASFPAAKVDESKPKSVKISGGSLKRTVDVVSCNWWNTNDYAKYANEVFRGVRVLDAHKRSRENDQPFYHVALLDLQDSKTSGNLKRLVRLFKSLKYDADSTNPISSFDIEAIVYRMNEAELSPLGRGQEVLLALLGYEWLHKIDEDATLRQSLRVPDEKRAVFADGHATHQQLKE